MSTTASNSGEAIKKEGYPFNIYEELEPFRGRTFRLPDQTVMRFASWDIVGKDDDQLVLVFVELDSDNEKRKVMANEKDFKKFWANLESPSLPAKRKPESDGDDGAVVVSNVTLGLKSFSDDNIKQMGDALTRLMNDAAEGKGNPDAIKQVVSLVNTSTGLINAEVAAKRTSQIGRKHLK